MALPLGACATKQATGNLGTRPAKFVFVPESAPGKGPEGQQLLTMRPTRISRPDPGTAPVAAINPWSGVTDEAIAAFQKLKGAAGFDMKAGVSTVAWWRLWKN